MNYSQNVNYYCSTELNHLSDSISNDSSNPSVLKDDLKQLKLKRHTLEDQKAEHECLKSENNNLMNQKENLEKAVKDAVKRYHELIDKSNSFLADKESKQNQFITIQSTIDNLKKKEKEFKSFIFSQRSESKIACDDRAELEHIYVKSKEYNEELRKILTSKEYKEHKSERKRVQLMDEIAHRSSEMVKCCGDLVVAENAMQTESERLEGLQQRKATCEQALKQLAAQFADRQAELIAFEAKAMEWSTEAERSTQAVAEERAAALAELSNAVDARRRAVDALYELKASVEAEDCRRQAVLRELCQENDRLTRRLSDESARQGAMLADRVRAEADRLAGVTAEMYRLERRLDHERALLAARRIMCDGEMSLLGWGNVAMHYRSEMARDEIAALKCKLSDCRDSV